ncbi:MAG: hypothetical protein A3G34_13780 [Candidatus Lindowbacteria bacterium RIFCSPLOWO2_12_FULL_62_27]|nr:MAG: hypothetical protein A3I06_12515 [Candidatus Lindowbacteria bacterium RIFCSPLOWO2_02_FULL_62_12]OGH62647.1 MAG: hypothetical protein A3G34_13780 [Candidatus Lindowbacteria bacterium RIFCSPLOWO2_12_FULL_62_27]
MSTTDRLNPRAGFTLIELLIATLLMAMLAGLLYAVFTNCRRTAAAAQLTADRLRKEIVLREMIQAELDRSASPFTYEYLDDRPAGFSVLVYGDWGGRYLRLRIRYVFERDPDRPAFRLVRYAIADGIGVKETREFLLEGLRRPVIEAYSEAAGGFVPAEEVPAVTSLIRLKFQALRSWPPPPGNTDEAPADEFRLMLSNAFAETHS